MEDFDPDSGAPGQYRWEVLADWLAAQIESGRLKPGARLPGERDLAAQTGVSVGTVRRAVAELQRRGLVVTRAVLGTFVLPRDGT